MSPARWVHSDHQDHAEGFASFVILSCVLALYGIYVLCTFALLWTAIAVIRHIRLHRRLNRSRREHHDESA